MEYGDNRQYTLRAVTEDGKMGTPIKASCRVEEKEGAGPGSNLVMIGFLEERRVVANVTTVEDKLHIFTSVSYIFTSPLFRLNTLLSSSEQDWIRTRRESMKMYSSVRRMPTRNHIL